MAPVDRNISLLEERCTNHKYNVVVCSSQCTLSFLLCIRSFHRLLPTLYVRICLTTSKRSWHPWKRRVLCCRRCCRHWNILRCTGHRLMQPVHRRCCWCTEGETFLEGQTTTAVPYTGCQYVPIQSLKHNAPQVNASSQRRGRIARGHLRGGCNEAVPLVDSIEWPRTLHTLQGCSRQLGPV